MCVFNFKKSMVFEKISKLKCQNGGVRINTKRKAGSTVCASRGGAETEFPLSAEAAADPGRRAQTGGAVSSPCWWPPGRKRGESRPELRIVLAISWGSWRRATVVGTTETLKWWPDTEPWCSEQNLWWRPPTVLFLKVAYLFTWKKSPAKKRHHITLTRPVIWNHQPRNTTAAGGAPCKPLSPERLWKVCDNRHVNHQSRPENLHPGVSPS